MAFVTEVWLVWYFHFFKNPVVFFATEEFRQRMIDVQRYWHPCFIERVHAASTERHDSSFFVAHSSIFHQRSLHGVTFHDRATVGTRYDALPS